MIKEYPITEADQTKLFKAGYVLVKADFQNKQIYLVTPEGSTINYQVPSKRALGNFVAEAALTRGTIVNDPYGGIHKTSRTRLLADGYKFIRLCAGQIRAQTQQKDWHKVSDILEEMALRAEFKKHLQDNKTIEL